MKVNVLGHGAISGVGVLPVYGIELNQSGISRLLNFHRISVVNAETGLRITRQNLASFFEAPAKPVEKAEKPVVAPVEKKPEPVVEPVKEVYVEPVAEVVSEPAVEEEIPAEEIPADAVEVVEEVPVEETVNEVVDVAPVEEVTEEAPVVTEEPEVVEEKTETTSPYKKKKRR